jgi:hypothetical protein
MRAAKRRPPPLTNRARRLTWTGGCFQHAAKVMLAEIDAGNHAFLAHARLCHGKVRDSFHACRWIDHAWVEAHGTATMSDGSTQPITMVIDDSQPDPTARMLPLEVFVEKTQARDVRRYDAREMLRNALRTHSDGPWA